MPLTTFVSAGRRVLPNQWDLVAFAAISGCADGRRQELPRPFRPSARAERVAGVARLLAITLLRVPHGAADVRSPRRLARLHLHLCDARGQEPTRRNGADPGARRAAVGADPGLSLLHRDLLPRPLPRPYARRGARGDLRHLHQPSLEHGLFLLPVAEDRAGRSRRSRARLPPDRGRGSGSSKRHSPCRASCGTR